MRVREIMTTPPIMLLADDSILSAARAMRARDIGMIPIVADMTTMRLVGVITESDIAMRCVAERHWGGCAIREHMTKGPLHTVQPAEDLGAVVRVMRAGGVRRLPVVDAAGRLVGVVGQTDVVANTRLRDLRVIENVLTSVPAPVLHA